MKHLGLPDIRSYALLSLADLPYLGNSACLFRNALQPFGTFTFFLFGAPVRFSDINLSGLQLLGRIANKRYPLKSPVPVKFIISTNLLFNSYHQPDGELP